MTWPFDLLAITPPSGPVDPELVTRWLAAGARPAPVPADTHAPARAAAAAPVPADTHAPAPAPVPADTRAPADRPPRAGTHVPADTSHPAPSTPAARLAVLLREPGTGPEGLLDPAGRLAAFVRACRGAGLPLLLAVDPGHVARALSFGPDGLHLRGDPPPARLAELRPRVRGLLGRACHGAPQPGHACVDYTLLAPIFPPTTAGPGAPLGSKRPIGLAGLRAWTADPTAAIVALGGVDPDTGAACLDAGARALAGIGVFFGPPERVEHSVAALCGLVRTRAAHVLPPRP